MSLFFNLIIKNEKKILCSHDDERVYSTGINCSFPGIPSLRKRFDLFPINKQKQHKHLISPWGPDVNSAGDYPSVKTAAALVASGFFASTVAWRRSEEKNVVWARCHR